MGAEKGTHKGPLSMMATGWLRSVVSVRGYHVLVTRWHFRITLDAAMSTTSRPVSVEAKPCRITIGLSKTAVLVIGIPNDSDAIGGVFDLIGFDLTPTQGAVAPMERVIAGVRLRAFQFSMSTIRFASIFKYCQCRVTALANVAAGSHPPRPPLSCPARCYRAKG